MLQSRKGFNGAPASQTSPVLKNQLAFALYACAKETTRKFKEQLKATGLTYTQYIAMLVLWEKGSINVKALGEQLYLDSGTLTPMLKKMEAAGIIKRERDKIDERNVIVSVTEAGLRLRAATASVSESVARELPINGLEIKQLSSILDKLLTGLTEEK